MAKERSCFEMGLLRARAVKFAYRNQQPAGTAMSTAIPLTATIPAAQIGFELSERLSGTFDVSGGAFGSLIAPNQGSGRAPSLPPLGSSRIFLWPLASGNKMPIAAT